MAQDAGKTLPSHEPGPPPGRWRLLDFLSTITVHGRRLFDLPAGTRLSPEEMESLCAALLSSRGEASGTAIAERLMSAYEEADAERRLRFFQALAERFGIDADDVVAAAEDYQATGSAAALLRLQLSSETRRQELFRRLNLAQEGTARLVRMRADLIALLGDHPELRAVDFDFEHLFKSWFNRGFLELRRIDWNQPAVVLDLIIKHEAVHQIADWSDLRRRIDPPDRRLYAFFHPRMGSDPLIFVEVALTGQIPGAIDAILSFDAEPIDPTAARTAVFYSISNCHVGLRGVSFGNLLIKQVVEDLRRELPNLKTFTTLSPMPGFARWLDGVLADAAEASSEARELREALARPGWLDDEAASRWQPVLMSAAAFYLVHARSDDGRLRDPVARFHLGNGARLERINWRADLGASAMARSHGIMANYVYKPSEIERNHEAFANAGRIAASRAVTSLAREFRFGLDHPPRK